ncbi:Isochorismatase family [Aspergillus sclerotialis]|uniref:Isochorismatase family n=1 Tax=Aspergillus sclerotialis TaxID=2070753 RepID=A0A3A2ZWV7_9EURO|nr:Isochorismatase family [Aspergillus sclerotialis]
MEKTALLLLDLQPDLLSSLPNHESYLEKVITTLTKTNTSRNRSTIDTIHVTTSFRPNYPELHPNNPSTDRIKASDKFIHGTSSAEIHPSIPVTASDIYVTKKRVSAFSGSDLDMLLKSMKIENLVIAGIITSGAVLSTVRAAADLDYTVTVLGDLCVDRDQEVHDILVRKVFPKQATVIRSEEWTSGFGTEN